MERKTPKEKKNYLLVDRSVDLGRDLLGLLRRRVRRVGGGVLGLAGVVSRDVQSLGGGLGGLFLKKKKRQREREGEFLFF